MCAHKFTKLLTSDEWPRRGTGREHELIRGNASSPGVVKLNGQTSEQLPPQGNDQSEQSILRVQIILSWGLIIDHTGLGKQSEQLMQRKAFSNEYKLSKVGNQFFQLKVENSLKLTEIRNPKLGGKHAKNSLPSGNQFGITKILNKAQDTCSSDWV